MPTCGSSRLPLICLILLTIEHSTNTTRPLRLLKLNKRAQTYPLTQSSKVGKPQPTGVGNMSQIRSVLPFLRPQTAVPGKNVYFGIVSLDGNQRKVNIHHPYATERVGPRGKGRIVTHNLSNDWPALADNTEVLVEYKARPTKNRYEFNHFQRRMVATLIAAKQPGQMLCRLESQALGFIGDTEMNRAFDTVRDLHIRERIPGSNTGSRTTSRNRSSSGSRPPGGPQLPQRSQHSRGSWFDRHFR